MMMRIILKRARCPAGGRSRVPGLIVPSPGAAGPSWASGPEPSALSLPGFSNPGIWEKHKPFPTRRSKKLLASTGLWLFWVFFSLPVTFSQEAKPRQVHSERFPGLENSPLATAASFAGGFKDASSLRPGMCHHFVGPPALTALSLPVCAHSAGKRKGEKLRGKKKIIKGKIQLRLNSSLIYSCYFSCCKNKLCL